MAVLRTLLQTLGWLFVAALAGLWWLVTPWGAPLLPGIINAYTARMETPVVLGKLQGNVWRDFRLSSVSVADEEGLWLAVDGIRVRWEPLKFLGGLPFLDTVSAENINVYRLPQTEEKIEKASSSGNWMGWLALLPKRMDAWNVVVGQGVVGKKYALRFHMLQVHPLEYVVALGSSEGPATSVVGVVKPDPQGPAAALRFEEEPNGIFGNFIGIPDSYGMSGSVVGGTRNGVVSLERAVVAAGNAKVEVDGNFNLRNQYLDSRLRADVKELKTWEKMTGSAVSGHLQGVAVASGTWPLLDTAVSLTLVDGARHGEVQYHGQIDAKTPAAAGKLTGNLRQGRSNYRLKAAISGKAGTLVVPSLRIDGPGALVSATGAWQKAPSLLEAHGDIAVDNLRPLARFFLPGLRGQLHAHADASMHDAVLDVNAKVHDMDIAYRKFAVKLHAPTSLVVHNNGGTLAPTMLDIAGGRVTAHGSLSAGKVDAALAFSGMRPENFMEDFPLQGEASGSVVVQGTPAAPRLSANAGFDGTSGQDAVRGRASATWVGNALDARVHATLNGATVDAQGRLQASLGLLPPATTLGKDTPLAASVSGTLPLAALNPYLWASEQSVSGSVALHGSVGGTLGAPKPDLTAALHGGGYRNTMVGACLENVNASARLTPAQVTLSSLTATAPKGGTLRGSGRMGLAAPYPLSADVTLDKLQMFCGGLMAGGLDGTLSARGDLQGASTLGGTLTVGPLNIQIPGNDPDSDIPHVDTIRAKRARVLAKGGGRRRAPRSVTRLAVTLHAPNQIFVRGRGLDAEFGGDLTVGGRLANPRIEGTLAARRGTFAFLGRNLTLGDTTIVFAGPIPPSPFLNVKATSHVEDHDLTITLSGPAMQPTLALTSDPALPQDESLSMLLFGKRLERISPFQALQLAQAARVLSGADGGQPGLIDKARQRLGLDTLDIGSDTENNVTVTTGKYITDKIYLSVKQGGTATDNVVRTEIELTPSVSGFTEVDATGQQNVGLTWKHDY